MKNIFFLFLISTCTVEASDISTFKKENKYAEKIYLSPESLLVSEKQIYIKLSKDLIPVEHLHSDYHGIYVLKDELEASRRFLCLRCNSIHSIEEGCQSF